MVESNCGYNLFSGHGWCLDGTKSLSLFLSWNPATWGMLSRRPLRASQQGLHPWKETFGYGMVPGGSRLFVVVQKKLLAGN